MIKTAVLQGIRFDYLLTDSWFTCFEVVKFLSTRRIKCHFLGMLKKNATKYIFADKELNFNQILTILKRRKMQRNRKLNCHFYEAIVDFNGISVNFFFCKSLIKQIIADNEQITNMLNLKSLSNGG